MNGWQTDLASHKVGDCRHKPIIFLFGRHQDKSWHFAFAAGPCAQLAPVG